MGMCTRWPAQLLMEEWGVQLKNTAGRWRAPWCSNSLSWHASNSVACLANQRMGMFRGLELAALNAARLQKAQRSGIYLKMFVLLLLWASFSHLLSLIAFPFLLKLAARNGTGFLATTQCPLSHSHDVLICFPSAKVPFPYSSLPELPQLCVVSSIMMASIFPLYSGKRERGWGNRRSLNKNNHMCLHCSILVFVYFLVQKVLNYFFPQL